MLAGIRRVGLVLLVGRVLVRVGVLPGIGRDHAVLVCGRGLHLLLLRLVLRLLGARLLRGTGDQAHDQRDRTQRCGPKSHFLVFHEQSPPFGLSSTKYTLFFARMDYLTARIRGIARANDREKPSLPPTCTLVTSLGRRALVSRLGPSGRRKRPSLCLEYGAHPEDSGNRNRRVRVLTRERWRGRKGGSERPHDATF